MKRNMTMEAKQTNSFIKSDSQDLLSYVILFFFGIISYKKIIRSYIKGIPILLFFSVYLAELLYQLFCVELDFEEGNQKILN